MKRFMAIFMALVLVSSMSFPMMAIAQKPASEEALVAGLLSAEQNGRAWYVAPNGVDDEAVAGTIDHPFATISYATSRMSGGDMVYVRGGTYRDEITNVPSGTAEHPSTICAYQGEEVWMTGGEPVTGWTRTEENPNIWVADMDWDMYDVNERDMLGDEPLDDYTVRGSSIYHDDLVFVGGNPAPEGRWPNATVDQFLDRERYAKTDRANATSLTDADLPTDVDFTGAGLWIASGGGYQTQMGTITKHNVANHQMDIKSNVSVGYWMYNPGGGNYYFVTKSLATLDVEGEWYKDREAGKLYLYSKSNPDKLGVEAQKRAQVIRIGYGKDEKGKITFEPTSYVTIRGINTRLGGTAFSCKSSHCTFEQSVVDCPDHRLEYHANGRGMGILLSGTDNLVTRCEIKHAYGAAVEMHGSRNSFVNNYVHDVGYEHNEESGAIRISGSEHLISHNTVHHVMRQALGGYFEACDIGYNDFYDCMNVSRDGGVVYFNLHDYGNTELHHNWLHGDADAPADEMHVGLYLDSFTSSMVIYRNVVYGIQSYEQGNRTVNNNGKHLTYQQNPNSLNNVYLNNTFVNYRPTHLNFYANHDISGTVFVNNIFQSMSFIDGPTYYPWSWIDIYDNVKRLGYAVQRDVLAEMGAWFDREHNIEGKFEGNTWPPIENQWTNPASGDFTLVEGSRAIDAGTEIDGVTDGYVGEAPDLGAYEFGGEAWKPGCDLSRDIEDTFELNERIPYVNRLEDRGFENVTSDDGHDDFAGWEEVGSPESNSGKSAWSTWGWVVKQGNRCAVLASDGDALVQHVSGLKPNTAYRVGGYGFVAGRHVEPSALTGAKRASGEVSESDLVTMRKKYPVSLEGLTELSFAGVDFGKGRNRVCVGLKSPKVRSGDQMQVVSVALGSPDNVVGSYEMTKNLSTAEISWRWVTIDLGETYTGTQDVYLVLSGDFSGTSCAGFFPDSSASTDMLTITAAPTDAGAATANITNWYKPFDGDYYAPHSTVVWTGASGELDFKVAKQGSDMVAYADEMFLSELPGGENFGNQEACTHVFETDTCDASWKWRDVEEYRTPYLTLTCSACGERVEVQPPVTREEDATYERCSARYDVVGGVCESVDGEQKIPYHSVTAKIVEGGSVTPSTASAKRGEPVGVTVAPDDGYALDMLSYYTVQCGLDRSNKSLIRTRSFSMPPDDVVVTVQFKPLVIGDIAEQAYTGEPVEPKPEVRFGDSVLEEGTNYTLSYEDNVERGAAKVTVTMLGNNTGSASSTFEIGRASIAKAKISGLGTWVYSGKAAEPEPKVVLDGVTLKRDVDYVVSYSGNVKAGTATVKVTGKGNYTDSASATFKISPASIATAKVTGLSSQVYSGKACKPAPTVKLGSVTLKAGTDYTVSYANNVNAGTATVKVDGTGNYTGSSSATFKIGTASVASAKITGLGSCTYSGKAVKPVPKVVVGNVALKQDADYTVSYANNVNAGTATVKVTGKGNYAGSSSATFKIGPASVASAKITGLGSQVYSGKAFKPVPTVKLGTTALKPGSDYVVSYSGNVKAGTASVKITGKGNYTGNASATFKIGQASNPLSVKAKSPSVSASKLKKGNRTIAVGQAFTVSKAQGKVTYKKVSGNNAISVSNAGKITVKKGLKKSVYALKVKVTAAGNANYKSGAETVTVRIAVK